MRWTMRAVWAGWAIFALLAALAFVVFPLDADTLAFIVPEVLIGAYSLALATVVARRAPGNVVSTLLALNGIAVILTVAPTDELGPLAGDWMLLYLPMAYLLLLMPDGHFGGALWRGVGIALGAVVLSFNVVISIAWWAGAATSDGSVLGDLGMVLLLAFFGLLVACVVSLVPRYRRGDQRTRLQLRWIFVAGMTLPLTLLLCWTSYLLIGSADLVVFGLATMYLLIPTGAAIATVKPDWFDIDRTAAATLTATVLSVLVLIVLTVACATTGLTLLAWSPVMGIVATIVLTVVVVALFRPVQRWFARALFPDRVRALAALGALRQHVDAGGDEPESVQQVLRIAVHDEGLVVAYRSLAGGALVCVDGTQPVETALTTEVVLRGEAVGAIIPGPTATTRPSRAVIDAAAPLIDAVRMRAELKHAMDEVTASRERLLLAGYEERRRLERDLHDGAQQRLVALGMRLRVLQRGEVVSTETASALDTAVAELGTAVAELRQIAHGVRPSALDDGLAAALAGLTRLAPATIVLQGSAGELPDAVGTTAYYVASEAVTNAMKHSGASRIGIEVAHENGILRIAVTDDGHGGAQVRPSAGLAGLQDRVAALGGRLEVSSPVGSGTVVEAVLPCGS